MDLTTEIIRLSHENRAEALPHAAQVLLKGGVVALPTETVYGLCCHYGNAEGLDRICKMKDQPKDKPFQVLVGTVDDARKLCSNLSRAAEKLMRLYWPGALTLILDGPDGATVGLRLPDHPDTRAVLRECAMPLCATSANRHGHPPAIDGTTAIDVFSGEVDLILDGGTVPGGVASTVVRISEDGLNVIREGAITSGELAEAVRPCVLVTGDEHASSGPITAAVIQRMLGVHIPDVQVKCATPAIEENASPLSGDGPRRLLELMGYGEEAPEIVSLDATQLDRADIVLSLSRERAEYLESTAPWIKDRIQVLVTGIKEFPDPKVGQVSVGPGYGEIIVKTEKAVWKLCRELKKKLS